jgi:hypothetical protein
MLPLESRSQSAPMAHLSRPSIRHPGQIPLSGISRLGVVTFDDFHEGLRGGSEFG